MYLFILHVESAPPIYMHLSHLLLSLPALSAGSFFHSSQKVCSLCLHYDTNRVNKKKDYEYSIKIAMFLLNRPAAV